MSSLPNQPPATPPIGLDFATQDPTRPLGKNPSVAKIRIRQICRTKQKRGPRLAASSGPKSCVEI